MKTLALQKIIERRDLLLEKIENKTKQLDKNEINAVGFLVYFDNCRYEFKWYINSLMDMKIITNDDVQILWDGFTDEINNIYKI